MTMHCKTARPLLTAYYDGELDLPLTIALEAHLAECPECSNAMSEQRSLSRLIRSHAPYYQVPHALRTRLATSLPITQPHDGGLLSPPRGRALGQLNRRASLVAFGNRASRWSLPLAAAFVVGIGVSQMSNLRTADNSLEDTVIAGHVRSLQVNHIDDVVSTDQHTVKPWFAGKLDYTFPVPNLVTEGFPLAGGRLDYVERRDVAALDYRRRQHVINVFVWPTEHENGGHIGSQTRETYNIEHWRTDGLEWWAVSDLNAAELKQFSELMQKAAAPAPKAS